MKISLAECAKPCLYAGTVFTFTGDYPFDKEPVQFMLCEYHSGKAHRSEFALYCVSGYHSGSLEYVFPIEAQAENVQAISTQWLKDNWKSKVCGGCEASDVVLTSWIWDREEKTNQI